MGKSRSTRLSLHGCPNGAGENCLCESSEVELRNHSSRILSGFKSGLILYTVLGVAYDLVVMIGLLAYQLFVRDGPLTLAPFVWIALSSFVLIAWSAWLHLREQEEQIHESEFRALRCAVRQLQREREELQERLDGDLYT